MWQISARSFRIFRLPIAHNFWCLIRPDGSVANQIHGLAVDSYTGQIQPLGNRTHLLQAISSHAFTWSLQPNQPTVSCYSGSYDQLFSRWQAALHAIPAINALKLPYPNLWEHHLCPNSNSIFQTIGQILGVTDPGILLPFWAPGIHVSLPEDIINSYRYIEMNNA